MRLKLWIYSLYFPFCFLLEISYFLTCASRSFSRTSYYKLCLRILFPIFNRKFCCKKKKVVISDHTELSLCLRASVSIPQLNREEVFVLIEWALLFSSLSKILLISYPDGKYATETILISPQTIDNNTPLLKVIRSLLEFYLFLIVATLFLLNVLSLILSCISV